MAEFSRQPQRFTYAGLALNAPADALALGKYPLVTNLRSYQEHTLQPRAGYTALLAAPLASAVHTLARLNDSITGAAFPAWRLIGSGVNLHRQIPGAGATTLVTTGFSSNPLTLVINTPPLSPEPFAYIADSLLMQRISVNGDVDDWGIDQPSLYTAEPAIAINSPVNNLADFIESVGPPRWEAVGDGAAPSTFERLNTTIADILYDDPAPSWASIIPGALDGMTEGVMLDVNGGGETTVIEQITVAIANTTIAAIIYDVGLNGPCTIQPTASLGTGQLDSPPMSAYNLRANRTSGARFAVPRGQVGVPIDPITPDLPTALNPDTPLARIRQVDFPVNCLVRIGGELVRILSVAVGTDGVQSFRCDLVGTHAAGEAIIGDGAFRCYLQNNYGAGTSLVSNAVEQVITPTLPPGAEEAVTVGGITRPLGFNLAQIGDRATHPDDELCLSVRCDRLSTVNTIRLYLDVNDGPADFLQNYYFFEWRANDLIAAIQAINAEAVSSLSGIRPTVDTNAQLDQPPTRQAVPRTPGSAPAAPPTGSHTRTPQAGLPTAADFTFPTAADHARHARNRNPATVAGSTADTAISQQLAFGNNQWLTLRVKLRDLIHAGTDTARTLADIAQIEILVNATTGDPITVGYNSLWAAGTFGPDVGATGTPYVYVYRGRSSLTGALSNPSPPSRNGVIPRRQDVSCIAPILPDSSADLLDWFRLGGALDRYTYVGSHANDGSEFADETSDVAILGGESPAFDHFKPWATADLPRSGTANVAGTAVQRTSGDDFNIYWAPGTVILINDRTCRLFASPYVDDVLTYPAPGVQKLHLHENAGAGTNVEWSIPSPLLLATPLPAVWGDLDGTWFACGDADNPGTLYWSQRNTLDAMGSGNTVLVTGGGEPLQHGYVYDNAAFVASSQQQFVILPDGSGGFTAKQTPAGRGFWTRWAFALAPEGCYFLAEDGIYLTAGGAAQPLTDPDLRPLFPHDGLPGTIVNGIAPPDMTQTVRLRLAYIDGLLYFDYADTLGAAHTLILDTKSAASPRWYHDSSAAAAHPRCRLEEPGAGVHNQILGCSNGQVAQYQGTSDFGAAIAWTLYTSWLDGGDPRVVKQWGDVGLHVDAAGGTGVTVQVVTEFGTVVQVPVVLGAGIVGRATYLIDLTSGAGILATNLGLRLSGSSAAVAPVLYFWEPSAVAKAENIARRGTDWSDLGYQGAKFVQGVLLRANTFNLVKSVNIQADGGVLEQTISVQHNGEVVKAYPLAAAGWTPFLTHLVRAVGADDVPWQLYDATFIWEPAPEAATEWTTQETTHDLPGYLAVTEAVIAYSTAVGTPEIDDVTFTVRYVDGPTHTYVLPSTAGAYNRIYLNLRAGKGTAVQYKWNALTPFRLFKKDMSVRVVGWGLPEQSAQPFGGPHRADGAAV